MLVDNNDIACCGWNNDAYDIDVKEYRGIKCLFSISTKAVVGFDP